MAKISVLIVDDNESMVHLLTDILSAEEEIGVVGKANNGFDALNLINEKKPDIVLLDLIMPKLDGLEVMRIVHNNSEYDKIPYFIVITAIGQENITQDAFDLGASYYIMKPFDNNVIINRIKEVSGIIKKDITVPSSQSSTENKIKNTKRNLESDVTRFLHEIGVPAHVKGYQYLRDAIILSVNDFEILNSVTKLLYPTIAQKNKTTSSRVERAIRHAIELAWGRDKSNITDKTLQCMIQNEKGKPSNSEFIALISDKLRLEYKSDF